MQPVTGTVLIGNTLIAWFHCYNRDDLLTDADQLQVTVYKNDSGKLLALSQHKNVSPTRRAAGQYEYVLPTSALSSGEYVIVWSGSVDGYEIAELIRFSLATVSDLVRGA